MTLAVSGDIFVYHNSKGRATGILQGEARDAV